MGARLRIAPLAEGCRSLAGTSRYVAHNGYNLVECNGDIA